METLFTIVIQICALFMASALCEMLISDNKNAIYVKTLISALVIMSVIEFIFNIDFKSDIIETQKYEISTDSIWDNTLDYAETELENKILSICTDSGFNIKSVDVNLKTDYKKITVESINLYGIDSNKAKSYLSSYLKTDSAYINIGD